MTEIRVRDLRVSAGSVEILRGIDLDVRAGEWLNIVGPNGAGKTTLLRSILGSLDHSGSVLLDGVQNQRGSSLARTVAYVPQVPVVPPGLLVSDYVLLGRTPHRGPFAADSPTDLAVTAEVLGRLDLGGFARREVRSLSGGERQRVVMARALAQQTPVLLLDEPTTALDLGHQQDVLELVEELRHERGLTVVATLHDLTLAARYGERVAMLDQGRLVQVGPAGDVLTVDAIRTHFHATVRIIDDDAGPIIVPAIAAPTTVSPSDQEQS